MVFICVTVRRDSVSFLRFPFLSHVQVLPCNMSLVCRLKCPYSCLSSHFCFLIIFVLLILVLSVLFMVAMISLPPRFFMQSSSRCIDASTILWMLASHLPHSFLDTYSLSTSYTSSLTYSLSTSHTSSLTYSLSTSYTSSLTYSLSTSYTSSLTYSLSTSSLVQFKNGPYPFGKISAV